MDAGIRSNVPLEQAKTEYIRHLRDRGFTPKTEEVPVLSACGRITAEAVYAVCSAPSITASAMDGIAVKAGLTANASETEPVRLLPGEFTRIVTGDPVPENCDTVIMAEELEENGDGSVTLRRPAAPWHHIRQIGEDICVGEMILPAYTKISPAALGALTAGGRKTVRVFCRPTAGILTCGEMTDTGTPVYAAMLREWGAETVIYPVRPDREALRETLRRAAAASALVLISAGKEDETDAALEAEGEIFCRGIAMKPGKPALLGSIGDKPVIGVPRYPISGILILEELLKPLVGLASEDTAGPEEYAEAVLTKGISGGEKYRETVRVRMGCVEGKMTATPLNRGSGVVSSFLKTDGLLTVPPEGAGIRAGETVKVRLLKSRTKIEHSLILTGSHDPLLDELGDLMHRADREVTVSSVHVGSMGGIQAIRRGEAHAAGCHLLDTRDGSYNLAFLRKYFPGGEVRLVRGVGRQQGLMVTAGNPLGIREFADVCRPGLRYVNRQSGSGTRILTDYLCGKYGIDTGTIEGYGREEMTHSSVAAQIASGSADAGMGIRSAAEQAGLDFIPVCDEEYDLIVPVAVWDSPLVQLMLETLKSGEFRRRLLTMGGYTAEGTGEVIEYLI